ncbi:multicopper oxidase domain-containing protein [Kibdelosporangium philippinense]|uniref:Multicopper oxidase domain-containing protein n=1 Tax=Kibdelosporangium philippinense TaxID=211113 RepID=A0ABS8ZBY6_9PSEU|nr:multicopper oxidase domain-containing protein [Kibdelosporangium philippinense]MCE7004196.1 multicopper oxidase domain-containing protein [Kibdelosporangium philippinense]
MDKHAQTGWLSKLVTRRSVLATSTVGLAVPAAMTLGTGASGVHTAQAQTGVVKKITMYVEDLPGGLLGYGLEPGKASIPGPLLEIYEGDTLEITLVNRTTQRVSIHPHGVDYSVESDGSPLNASFNGPGETRVYTWRSREMTSAGVGRLFTPGSAGYWHYHDHANGTDHGTGGLAKGLYGGLIVRRRGDALPVKTFVAVLNDTMINHKKAPNTPMFECNLGERVEWLAIGHANSLHTFHLHAHRWADNRTGYLEGPADPSAIIDIKDLNPGTSFGFQVIAGQGVGPGAWMYHCHVQSHSDTGMAGIFLVRNADGSMPPGAQEAIDRFHGHVHAAGPAVDVPPPASTEGHSHN